MFFQESRRWRHREVKVCRGSVSVVVRGPGDGRRRDGCTRRHAGGTHTAHVKHILACDILKGEAVRLLCRDSARTRQTIDVLDPRRSLSLGVGPALPSAVCCYGMARSEQLSHCGDRRGARISVLPIVRNSTDCFDGRVYGPMRVDLRYLSPLVRRLHDRLDVRHKLLHNLHEPRQQRVPLLHGDLHPLQPVRQRGKPVGHPRPQQRGKSQVVLVHHQGGQRVYGAKVNGRALDGVLAADVRDAQACLSDDIAEFIDVPVDDIDQKIQRAGFIRGVSDALCLVQLHATRALAGVPERGELRELTE
mmetsp:Transcript_13778/g.58335  ORF Transcript_13778/g.58335 Transcript_13778/m.58335 type:complete len:305 (+) Transcript_13778:3824-4738(+)